MAEGWGTSFIRQRRKPLGNRQERTGVGTGVTHAQDVVIADLFAHAVEQAVRKMDQRMEPEHGGENPLAEANQGVAQPSAMGTPARSETRI